MRYSAEWLGEASNAAPEERATVADFRLWLNDQNACLHLENGVASDRVTISLYPLAEGLARDWWTIFGGRDREVSMMKHRSGYVTPDVRMMFDGAAFEMRADQRTYDNPGVSFWTTPGEVMSRREAELALGGFIGEVLARLKQEQMSDTSAALRWARVQESRDDPEQAAFCEAAGALGLDPYRIEEGAAASIEAAGALFEGEPLTEFLAGSAEVNRISLLEWVQVVERRAPYAARVGELRGMAQDIAARTPSRDLEQAWSLGYRRARALRRLMSLGPGDRFVSFRRLAERLGASPAFEVTKPVDGVQALRSDRPDGVRIHLRSLGHPTRSGAYLFGFTRAVGDAVCFPAETRAPINELHAAYRQAAGRAFAAEFLAPIDEIRSMREDGRDNLSIANDFGVSTAVIDHQEENAARIDEVCA